MMTLPSPPSLHLLSLVASSQLFKTYKPPHAKCSYIRLSVLLSATSYRQTTQPYYCKHRHKMNKTTSELGLPGFRFHPTEEELLDFYLRRMVLGKKQCLSIIGFLNIYHHEPWDLPGNHWCCSGFLSHSLFFSFLDRLIKGPEMYLDSLQVCLRLGRESGTSLYPETGKMVTVGDPTGLLRRGSGRQLAPTG